MIKNKKCRKKINLFDDQCIPDIQKDFKILYDNQSGIQISKSTKPCRQAGDYDPRFTAYKYNPIRDEKFLTNNLKIGATVPLDIKNKLIDILKENWCCFHPEGVKIPIRDYEVIIDTGTCKPFAAKNKRYGMHEAPIM